MSYNSLTLNVTVLSPNTSLTHTHTELKKHAMLKEYFYFNVFLFFLVLIESKMLNRSLMRQFHMLLFTDLV